jgi:hypothetical protein
MQAMAPDKQKALIEQKAERRSELVKAVDYCPYLFLVL